MTIEASKTTWPKRRRTSMSLPLALALSVFAAGPGAKTASAQEVPAPQTLTIYHSTDPTGADPRPAYPPGCDAPGTDGGGGDSDSGFDSFYDSDSGVDPGPSEAGWVVVLSDLTMAGEFNGESTDIQNPGFFDNLLVPNRNDVLIGRGNNQYTGAVVDHYQGQEIFVNTSETELTSGALVEYDMLVMSQPTGGAPISYTASELTAIRNFVEAGNLLLVIAEVGAPPDPATDSVNQLLSGIGSSIAYATEIEFGGALAVQAGAPFTGGLASFTASSATMSELTGGTALVTVPGETARAVVAAEALGGETGPECVVVGTSYEELELWIDGGDDPSTAGTVCKMGAEGGDGDEICGANISFNLSGPARFRSFIPMIPTLVIGAECVASEGVGCILPPANAKDLIVNFRKGDGTPPVGPRRLGSLIVDSTEFDPSDPTAEVLITASGEAATAKLQLLDYGKPEPATPEVIATLPIPMPEPGGSLQLLSGALGLMGLCRLRRRHRRG